METPNPSTLDIDWGSRLDFSPICGEIAVATSSKEKITGLLTNELCVDIGLDLMKLPS